MNSLSVDVCIIGGGPAGMLLGMLLASQNVKTLVLEQHHDFSREYRGEVLMPRFSKLFDEMGLLSYIKSYPHTDIRHTQILANDELLFTGDLSLVSKDYPYAIWMPQPVLLGALADKAKTYDCFDLWFDAAAQELIREEGKVVGVKIRQGEQEFEVRARLTVAADGRNSRIATMAGFTPLYSEHRFDVLWFSLPRPEGFGDTVKFHNTPQGLFLVAPKHPDLLQIGYMIPANGFAAYKGEAGLATLKQELSEGPEVIRDFAHNLTDLKPFHPLKAMVCYMKEWEQDGLLLVGDAAHTCSPMGAVGVSIACETAAVAAGVIVEALENNDVSAARLSKVRHLREPVVKQVHGIQHKMGEIAVAKSRVRFNLFRILMRVVTKFFAFPPFLPKVLLTGPEGPNPLDPNLQFHLEPEASVTSKVGNSSR